MHASTPLGTRIRQVPLDDPAAGVVLAGLAAEYEHRYGSTEVMSDASAEQFRPPDGAFVVLVDETGAAVAGGGLRRLTGDTAEIKRMWTAPAHRRRGHARVVLRALEQLAASRGYTAVRLETGPEQPEAAALYRRSGYRQIPNYGRYEEALGFERPLPTATAPGGVRTRPCGGTG